MDEEAYDALLQYAGTEHGMDEFVSCKEMQEFLLRPDTVDPERLERIQEVVGDLNRAFEHADPLPENLVVFRGVGEFDPKHYGNTAGFLSTALEKGVAEGFAADSGGAAGVVMRIHVPKGTKAIPLQRIKEATFPEYETELLFAPGAKLRYIGERVIDGRKVVEMVMLP